MKMLMAALAALGTVAATAAPAGSDSPMMLRTVTIDGVTGPAFYSAADGRYLFVGGDPSEEAARFAALPSAVR